jgi:hypothetical protein
VQRRPYDWSDGNEVQGLAVSARLVYGDADRAWPPRKRSNAPVDMKREVVALPVSDVDKAKDSYGNRWFVQEVTTRLPGR